MSALRVSLRCAAAIGTVAASLVSASLIAAPAPAIAQAPAPAPRAGELACGHALAPPILAAWERMGGQSGRMGCPTAADGVTAPSPRGSAAREATFAGGAILMHTSGPRAGEAYAVVACYRLYFQYGGAGGWLGLPVADAVNTPDGQRQAFEGGSLIAYRALAGCEATRKDGS